MGNLADVHDKLGMKEKDLMVKIWNSRNSDKITVGLFPFVNAWRMKTTIEGFYTDIEEGETVVFPSGVGFKRLIDYELHIKRVLYLATRKPKRVEPD